MRCKPRGVAEFGKGKTVPLWMPTENHHTFVFWNGCKGSDPQRTKEGDDESTMLRTYHDTVRTSPRTKPSCREPTPTSVGPFQLPTSSGTISGFQDRHGTAFVPTSGVGFQVAMTPERPSCLSSEACFILSEDGVTENGAWED